MSQTTNTFQLHRSVGDSGAAEGVAKGRERGEVA